MTILALVNQQTNICENVSVDDRPANEIQVSGYLVLDLSTTPAVDWTWNENAWVAVQGIGNGGIGDVWDGSKLVAPQPTEPLQTN